MSYVEAVCGSSPPIPSRARDGQTVLSEACSATVGERHTLAERQVEQRIVVRNLLERNGTIWLHHFDVGARKASHRRSTNKTSDRIGKRKKVEDIDKSIFHLISLRLLTDPRRAGL